MLPNRVKYLKYKKFREYWHVNKNDTLVCSHCEFRFICIDNRIPAQTKDKIWYYRQECAYNPYIGKWREEEGFRSLLDCGITINDKGLKINQQKLSLANKQIWEHA